MRYFCSRFYGFRDNSNDDIEDILKRDIEEYKREMHSRFLDKVNAVCGGIFVLFAFLCIYVSFISLLKDCH